MGKFTKGDIFGIILLGLGITTMFVALGIKKYLFIWFGVIIMMIGAMEIMFRIKMN